MHTKFVSFLKWLKEDCEGEFEQFETAERQTLSGILEGIVEDTDLAAHLTEGKPLSEVSKKGSPNAIVCKFCGPVS